jgi:hypothetical protein
MARVPVITSPCPIRWKSAPRDGADFCGQCQRRVHNLDVMSEAQREAFFADCGGKVCVSYTVARPRALAGIGVSVVAGAFATAAAMAADSTPSPMCPLEQEYIIVGGTNDGKALEWVDEKEAALPDNAELPEIDAADWLPAPDDQK